MIKTALACIGSLLLAGCASQPDRPSASVESTNGSDRTVQDLRGSQIATPVALFFAGMDANRDARVSSDELQSGLGDAFALGDSNQDGVLSAIEFLNWSELFLGAPYAQPSRLSFDVNQDTRVSSDEFSLAFAEIGSRLDRNGDGQLMRAEMLMKFNAPGGDPAAMRQQMEAEMRKKMEGKMREMCRRGR